MVLWLTKGEIEAAPLFPLRPIHAHEALVIKLGWEGALNTVEVKSMSDLKHKVTELVEVTDYSLLAPDTFVALDVSRSQGTTRLVGTITGVSTTGLHLKKADGIQDVVYLGHSVIEKAYWAPVGYRP